MIIGPNGEPIEAKDALPSQEQLAEWQAEVDDVLKREDVQLYAQCMLAGSQLMNWGRFFILTDDEVSEPVRNAVLHLLQTKIYDPATGRPRDYSGVGMLQLIQAVMPDVVARVERLEQLAHERVEQAATEAAKKTENDEQTPAPDAAATTASPAVIPFESTEGEPTT